MRFLELNKTDKISLTRKYVDQIPGYAILSHTWGEDIDEVTFNDLAGHGVDTKVGYQKLLFCGRQARHDGLQYSWVDTCCINKADHSELSEAIISMFEWYRKASKCYVFLSDVASRPQNCGGELVRAWEQSFCDSKWFTRGWTLQELLAPSTVEFFSKEGQYLGDKSSLEDLIHKATGIPRGALQGVDLSEFSVNERLSWAERRQTSRPEDKAYCLQGIFQVFFPPMYGEKNHAFVRLEEAIANKKRLREDSESDTELRKRRRIVPVLETDTRVRFTSEEQKNLRDSLRFDQLDDRYTNIKPNLASTCQWLIQSSEYADWLDSGKVTYHHGFFWIKGKPGCGKSTLMKFLLNELRRARPKAVLLSFFFNARGALLEKNIIGLYRSLLLQLLEHHIKPDKFWGTVDGSYDNLRNKLQTDIGKLKELLQQAVRMLKNKDVLVMVDALDECDDQEIRDMISFLERLGEDAIAENRRLHVLFSSRHYPHITIHKSINLTVDQHEGHSKDIDVYLARHLLIGKSKQAPLIREEIRQRASGVFIWVVLVVEMLNGAFAKGQARALRKKLREIPDDLYELFRDILTRDQASANEVQLFLQWVLFANAPLRKEELYFAVLSEIEPNDVGLWDRDVVCSETLDLFVLNSSKGLAEVTRSKKGIVQFIHESVRDFLLKGDGINGLFPGTQYVGPGEVHERLKACCVTYIRNLSSVEELPVRVLPKATTEEAIKMRTRAMRTYPFLKYSIDNVFHHANSSQVQGKDQTLFLDSVDIVHWVHLNNILEQFEVRRYPLDIDLLYILASGNYSHLVRIGARSWVPKTSLHSRHGNSVFAAVASESSEALEELISADDGEAGQKLRFPYGTKEAEKEAEKFVRKHMDSALTVRCLSNYPIVLDHLPATFLVEAAEKGKAEIVRLLLASALDLQVQARVYGDALNTAAGHGNEVIVRILLDAGADVGMKAEYYARALQAASTAGHQTIVRMLLDAVASVGLDAEDYSMALQAASVDGSETIVRILLDAGLGVDMQAEDYSPALQAASAHGSEAIVRMLLDAGANVSARAGKYDTVLHSAVICGHDGVVRMLLDAGADVNIQVRDCETVLQAASARGHETIVQMLLDAGADVNVYTKKHPVALYSAAKNGHVEMVRMLLRAGADISIQEAYYGTALQVTSLEGHTIIVQMLLDAGANVNIQVGEYGTALQAASCRGHETTVRMLLNAGADVNIQAGYYGTAIQAASAQNYAVVVEMLLAAGGDINVEAGHYRTALQAARAHGHGTMVELLLSKGAMGQ